MILLCWCVQLSVLHAEHIQTLMQRLTFTKGEQMYLSHIVNELGGSSGQKFQTQRDYFVVLLLK